MAISGQPGQEGGGYDRAVGTWDAVIDVSNVCWSPFLPPEGRGRPHWPRLGLVMDAWRELHSGAAFRLVADNSLWRALGSDDAREFGLAVKSGQLVTRPVADSLILELARDHSLHVITRDHYVDHRAAHPWIGESPAKFHCWTTVDGKVRIEPLGVVPVSAQTVSVAMEVKDLKRASNLDSKDPRHRKILGTRWKCANALCREAAQWQDHILTWPAVTADGQALCPSCASPLTGLGPRDPLYEVVVEDRASGDEITRFPLEVNSPVIVGRGAGLKGIDLDARQTPFRSAILHVSRQHLLLRAEHVQTSRRIAAVDLGSRNGTMAERWEQKAFLPPKPVSPQTDVYLGSKDRLVLGGTVNLRLSGRHFVTASGTSEPDSLAVPYWPGADAGEDAGSTLVIGQL
jgi:hypothetical protein